MSEVLTSYKGEIYSPTLVSGDAAEVSLEEIVVSTKVQTGLLAGSDEGLSEAILYAGPDEGLSEAIARASNGMFHGFEEHYPISMTIDAKIIEVNETTVTMECLVNPSERVFQERTFALTLLDGAVPVRLGQFIQIRVFQKPGKIVHVFIDGSKLVQRERFEYHPALSEEDYRAFEKSSS